MPLETCEDRSHVCFPMLRRPASEGWVALDTKEGVNRAFYSRVASKRSASRVDKSVPDVSRVDLFRLECMFPFVLGVCFAKPCNHAFFCFLKPVHPPSP